MKIAILLPYKENFSSEYPGSVSIFLKDIIKLSKYKNFVNIYGYTKFKNKFSKNYINLNFKKKILFSTTKQYLLKFIQKTSNKNIHILEIHNRPRYVKYLLKYFNNIVLYYHNDPLNQKGSEKVSDRMYLVTNLKFIIFNSNWTKKRFLSNLKLPLKLKKKLLVIHQSTDKTKVNLKKKKKIISFIGKLNTSKGYDIFGDALKKILIKYPDWKAVVIGDEQRESLNVRQKNYILLGFKKHKYIMNFLKNVNICVVPSRWEEPFGRIALEASSRGCALVISNKGGLTEAITNGIVIKKLNSTNLYNAIKKIIENPILMKKFQRDSLNNFTLTNKNAAFKIDNYRSQILKF